MIAVLGGGAWGTALAQVMARGGEDVRLWAREPEVVAAVNDTHANPLFLPDVALDPRIVATADMAALAAADVWLVVAPAQHLRSVLAAAPVAHRPTLVLCAKGIETGTRERSGHLDLAVDTLLAQDRDARPRAGRDVRCGDVRSRIEAQMRRDARIGRVATPCVFDIGAGRVVAQALHRVTGFRPL
ncbi:MAG TPA: 2-dehydropantoate 2-reductase N-terminal domain-containing protein, partial [Polymorphobacter sp.]|nr:2-dehydropantoate 2-reductase N-terminal domain-containing protein [Polymorphobacter sp.]